MFKAVKKWFIERDRRTIRRWLSKQVDEVYQEIMVIKSHQLNQQEAMEDHHAEVMARLDDFDDSLEELRAELISKKREKKKI